MVALRKEFGVAPDASSGIAAAAHSATLAPMQMLEINATQPWFIVRMRTDYTAGKMRTLCASPNELRVSFLSASLDYDAFGRIYEYFLAPWERVAAPAFTGPVQSSPTGRGEFAMSEGQGGRVKSELRSPKSELPSIRHSTFVFRHFQRLSIHGVEKTDETGRLCRLSLAVHGLEGEIKHGGKINSYYDDPHDATGRFNFVLANPPFNVNAVDTAMSVSARRHPESTPQDLPERQDHERLEDMVGPDRRFPFGLPRTDNATATRASAKPELAKPDRRSVGETELHYLWIQLFHSALNEKGRAGFVMANSTRSAHSCSVKISTEVRKYAAEQGIAEEAALKKGMEAKSKGFVEKGAEVYAKAWKRYTFTTNDGIPYATTTHPSDQIVWIV